MEKKPMTFGEVKPEFYMAEFEDYLFQAIQHARLLEANDVSESVDVERYLSLAFVQIGLYIQRVQDYHRNLNEKG